MVLRALIVLLLSACQALARHVDPTMGDLRVGLQCDVAANRALVRLGGADLGVPKGFLDLPPEAPRGTARIAEAAVWRDAVCQLGDGTEVRLRVVRDDWPIYYSSCTPHYITLWVGAQRVLKRAPITACAEHYPATTWGFQPAGRVGWVVTPSRLDVCRRPAPPVAGPALQCRIAGDPRLMGIRDWVQYPADGRQPRQGEIVTLYARDPQFCERLILRGRRGAPDHFALPDFDEHRSAIIDLDDNGRLVLIWKRLAADEAGLPGEARHYLLDKSSRSGTTLIRDASPDGKTVCKFRRSDDDEDDDR